jgi:hypothetical protein
MPANGESTGASSRYQDDTDQQQNHPEALPIHAAETDKASAALDMKVGSSVEHGSRQGSEIKEAEKQSEAMLNSLLDLKAKLMKALAEEPTANWGALHHHSPYSVACFTRPLPTIDAIDESVSGWWDRGEGVGYGAGRASFSKLSGTSRQCTICNIIAD